MSSSLLRVVLIAHLCGAGLYAGGCLYLSGAELPALRELELPAYAVQVRPMLSRAGRVLLPPLLVAVGTSALLWVSGQEGQWLWGAVCLLFLATLATTFAFNVPINVELLSGADIPLGRLGVLRARWALAHGLRTALACLAFLLGTWAASSR